MRYIIFLLVLPLFSCTSPNNPKENEAQPEGLLGTWDLKSYIDHPGNGTEWESYEDGILYQKHLTASHFNWVQYDLENEQLLGLGGGNYETRDDKYIENIDFFYPPGSSELGQTIPFDLVMKDGEWFHTGYAKEMEIDFETGEMVPGDSNKIEEIWVRSNDLTAKDLGLSGTWDLKHYRDKLDDSYYEYPEMTGYIKLITPTHFAWVKYDKQGDQIYSAGSGTYKFDGEQYIETVKMFHPSGSGLVGATIPFSQKLTNHKWDLFGYGPITNSSGIEDSVLIDEVWMIHVNTLEEEVALTF